MRIAAYRIRYYNYTMIWHLESKLKDRGIMYHIKEVFSEFNGEEITVPITVGTCGRKLKKLLKDITGDDFTSITDKEYYKEFPQSVY